ncbi:unknown [Firmicutes bacterium CAG:460]|nr:unknown [Firmicutes bacterium CAG:460]
MIKIDDKKIIVSFFDELKKVLEEYNTYNYFFLMNEISITEDIFIGLNVLTILLSFSAPSLSG